MRKLTSIYGAVAIAALAAVGVTIALVGPGRGAAIEPSFVSALALEAHGIDLASPSSRPVVGPTIDQESAASVVRDQIGIQREPREVHRVVVADLSTNVPRTAWLLLYEGGTYSGPAGPPQGADTRTFVVAYVGALVNDETGELMRWFEGGSFTE